jgi:hypothetical protein
MKIDIIVRIARSFFTGEHKKGSSRCLKVKLHRQWTPYSCTAAVMQMVVYYYGFNMSHRKAASGVLKTG